MQVVGLCPTPHKPFEKGLIQNLQVNFCLASRLNFCLVEICVRIPRQRLRRGMRVRGKLTPGKELLLNKFHNAFGEIREDDSSFLQTLFN
jgi:hypothetical protein